MRGPTAGATWRGFDPQTGRTAPTSNSTPRQQNTPFGNPRPKSAYEYFKDNIKAQNPTSPNSPKKRHGFAPGTAGGDEPMARNTSAYTNHRSERPSSMYFDSAPPPTAKRPPAAPEPPLFTEEFERSSSRYATAGGERTHISNTGVGRSASTRTPLGRSRTSYSRTSPPSPVREYPQRHHSASPKSRRRQDPEYSTSPSASSSDSDEVVFRPNSSKPKAVPKSRLRPHMKFSDFYGQAEPIPGTGEKTFAHPGNPSSQHAPPPQERDSRRPRRVSAYMDLSADSDDYKGHNSDSAAFTRGSNRPQQPPQFQGSTTRYTPFGRN